jgi:hypothetical protein
MSGSRQLTSAYLLDDDSTSPTYSMHGLIVTASSVAAAQKQSDNSGDLFVGPTPMPAMLLCTSTKGIDSGVQAYLLQQLVDEVVRGYRQLKTRAIRDVGFSEDEVDVAFHCERFTVTLKMPKQSDRRPRSIAPGASKDPVELASYALKAGAKGTSVWGVLLKQVHASGLVEIASIIPGSACAVAIAAEAVHGVTSNSNAQNR